MENVVGVLRNYVGSYDKQSKLSETLIATLIATYDNAVAKS